MVRVATEVVRPFQRLGHRAFRSRVERACRLGQQQDRAGQRQSLLCTARDTRAAFSHQRLVAFRQGRDVVVACVTFSAAINSASVARRCR